MVHVALGEPCELLADIAGQIQCPALFLHGEADALVPWGHAHAIHERITAAGGFSRWETVAGAGHMLIDYQASDLARRIQDSVNSWRASCSGAPNSGS